MKKNAFQEPPTSLDPGLLSAAINASNSGVVITDHLQPDEPIIYCNDAFERITGYQRQEIIGRNCRFLQGEDINQEARFQLRQALQNEEHCEVELRNYKKDGTLFWNHLIMSPVRNEIGNVTHFIGVQNDITFRKDIEHLLDAEKAHLEERVSQRTRELEVSEAYMESIVETVRESLIVLDQQMRILTVNAHFCNFFKLRETEVLGRILFDLGDGQWDLPILKDMLENVLPNNNPFEGFELENKFPRIGKKVLVLNARQITLKGKYQNRILVAIEDLTERREVEQRKDDFINIASHEMKGPLGVLKANFQVMERKLAQESQAALEPHFLAAGRSIERLQKLVLDLLDIARMQASEVTYHYEVFNFDSFTRAVAEHVESLSGSHRILVSGKTETQIEGDYFRLEQVMINLLNNAVKYSPDAAEVQVHIGLVGKFVKLTVIDSGVGIGKEDQKSIFNRFSRTSHVMEKFAGAGIGLYVCRRIIEQHHGSLWVESELGKGSAFSFTIPIMQND